MFGLFRNLSDNQKINRKISDLEERLEKAERRLRSLDLEWSEHYDKVRHALGRMAKRSAIIQAAQEAEEDTTEAQPAESSDGLSPQQRLWNQRILAARQVRGN